MPAKSKHAAHENDPRKTEEAASAGASAGDGADGSTEKDSRGRSDKTSARNSSSGKKKATGSGRASDTSAKEESRNGATAERGENDSGDAPASAEKGAKNRGKTRGKKKPTGSKPTGGSSGTKKHEDAASATPNPSNGEVVLDEEDVHELLEVLLAVKKGDFSTRYVVEQDGVLGRVADSLNEIIEQNELMTSEMVRVREKVGRKGRIAERASVSGFSGGWRTCIDSVNDLVEDLGRPITEVERVIGAVAKGDLSQTIDLEVDGEPVRGEFRRTAKIVNTMVDRLSSFASEVTRVAREVGTEGQLGGQAKVQGVSGTWKDLTDNVNSMADNLTTQVRGIAEVTTAVANGDLTKKITVEAKGEILELKNTINTMVDQLSGFASEVIRVAREVGTEGQLGGQARVKGVSGIWKDLTDNVNSMADNLTTQVRGIAHVTTAVANGDLTKKITVDAKGEIAELKNTINTMVDRLSSFASEVTRVAREVGTEGQLGGQAKVQGVSGTWKDLTDNVNSMADNLTTQVRSIAEVTTAVATGDLTKKITVDAKGEIQELKNTINTMIDQLSSFASEVIRVAREVGTEGKLGGQAEVEGVSGTWKDLTDNVNSMADNLTTQVRGIAEVTTAVAGGDLTKKITVDAKGEIQELKNTINTMVDQLSSFAAEVTRVAREVGTEGKLGGQAKVEGVSGTWKDLTDNVNSMADNLTTQVRGIAEVTTAVATGDLTKKITVDAKGEIQELKNTINTMVDQLSSFAAEVTRVAREVGTEGKLGGQAKVEGVSGTWKDLTDNVNSMADNLTTQVRGIAEVTTAVATGDLTKKITVDAKGEIQELKNTINTMVDQLSSFAAEVTRVAREVGTEGRLGGQAKVEGVSGTWKDLTDNVNSMADNLTTQVRSIAEVTTAVATGDLTKKITVDVQGEILELKNTINTMVDQLSSFASEVTRVAREVGTEGKLGGQAEVKGVSGTWKDLTDNVNSMADNLTTQVRGIAEVTTAVATGDLTKKITVEAKGEIAELKNTINTMVDQLSSFAAEVTRVAREVGTEGRLGGQARVEGVSGTWKDLTDNVNSMADNLTTQVRSIADVTTAVANGNLTKKITVDAKGEIAELKNTINTMVDQLSSFASEVTRVAREVGTEGKLGGQARVEGVSGTWKDLTDNVNSMANNLTTQVRGIADVVTAVARGNLKRKLSLEAKGEIAELADTINNMIDTLATFADQVTTVAREVGVEGKLGGQAEVPGASGTWRDLVDNVNQLAANLTTQVRAITEVTTAVAAGDLSKKITVEAAGEVADLKDNVNEMIRNLKETTRKNTEQDWLKTNLAKFTQLLQGQKDLKTVSKLVLSELAPLINVQHGAFYIAEQEDEVGESEPAMKLLATYAYKERKHLANRFELGEGLVGQCALEKERILLTNVPADYVQISSGLGEGAPYNIVVLPVLFEGKVKAVVELASFSEFKKTHLSFLDQLTESIGIVLNTLKANMRTEQLLAQSQKQQEELFYTNQRLEEKAQSLQKSEEMMKKQQEELQQTNRELEEKARLLAEQKDEVEEKNREIEMARRALQEKAEQLALTSKYKSEFLANMSHELRTPLNSMLILSKMLAEDKENSLTAKQIEYAETIYSSGADLLGLINEILDLSKIESGAMAVEASDVNLKEVAEEMDNLFHQVAHEKGLDFQIELEEGLPDTILTDKKRLQQVLKNLISNGLKFTDEGYVKLRMRLAEADETFEKDVLREADSVIAFSVIDTGQGISPDKQQIIFEAFQQADSGEGRSAGGTGLGLSISREIARLLGGELDLESTEGEGSTFTFYLPDTYVPTKLAKRGEGEEEEDGAPGPVEIPTLGRRKKFIKEYKGPGREADEEDQELATVGNGASRRGEGSSASDGRDGASTPDVSGDGASDSAEPAGATVTSTPESREHRDDPDGMQPRVQAAVEAQMQSMEGRPIKKGRVDDDRESIEADDRILLVVEDDAHFASVIRDIGHAKGFKIINATHAEEAMMMAKRYHPNAITLDVKLPGTHGLVLLDQLKNDPETRHVPVTILSVVDDLPRHQRKGALSHIKKPVSRSQVDATLTHMTTFADRPIKKLLVVEDDEAQRMSISELLAGDDVEIVSLKNGKKAIQEIKKHQFDCAVIDLGLPDVDGFDLVRKLREDLDLQSLPIVVHTGQELEDDEAEELARFADAVIVKDVRSLDRLLHETSIFLHRSAERMPEDARRRLIENDPSEVSLEGKRVMIVDDDIRNIFAVTSLLERHGMEIIYAESGQEGIEKLRESTDIDVVLMDIMMPGMDGYECTRRIRQFKEYEDLPIIAVTAKAMKGDREKCIEAGASDYITKPVNVEQLISILRLWIAN